LRRAGGKRQQQEQKLCSALEVDESWSTDEFFVVERAQQDCAHRLRISVQAPSGFDFGLSSGWH
jgi:hypothetical protein